MIREKFGFERWMVVGGSWGATLGAGLCAGASRSRHRHRACARPFSARAVKSKRAFLENAAALLSRTSARISSSLLPPEERAPTARCLLAADSRSRSARCTARPRAPGTTPSASFPSTARAAPGSISPSLNSSRALPSTPFMEAHYFAERLLHEAGPASCRGRQARRHSRHHRAGPLRSVVSAGDLACAGRGWPKAEIRIVEGAGHTLYDPGVRDAVMKAIADLASKIEREVENAAGRKRNAADLDGRRRRGRSRLQSLVRPRASRGARRDRRLSRSAALCRASPGRPKYLCLYSTETISTCSTARPIARGSPTRPSGRKGPWRASRT